jgi:hypothetical protein
MECQQILLFQKLHGLAAGLTRVSEFLAEARARFLPASWRCPTRRRLVMGNCHPGGVVSADGDQGLLVAAVEVCLIDHAPPLAECSNHADRRQPGPTMIWPLTCPNDLQRPTCPQMVEGLWFDSVTGLQVEKAKSNNCV